MKGRIRKPAQPVYRDRSPGPRERKLRAFEDLYARAEVKPKPRPSEPPQESKKS